MNPISRSAHPRSLPALSLGMLLLALLGGCASGPSRPLASMEDPDQQRAEQMMRVGEFRRAADIYLDLAARRPAESDKWRLRAAESLREEGDFGAMRGVLENVRSSQLPRGDLILLDLLLAEAEIARGGAATALDLLTWQTRDIPPRLLSRYHELRARALFDLGQYEASARERVALNDLLQGAERQLNELELLDTLSLMPMADLRQRLAMTEESDPMRNWLLAAASRIPSSEFDPEGWASAFDPGDADELLQSGIWQPEGYRPPRRVAVLLPLSGPLRAAANAVRDGILAAYYADPGQPPELQFIDSGENPTDALIAYQQAASTGADRIIGPLSREAVSLLLNSGRISTPMLMLNQGDTMAFHSGNVVQFGLPPEDDATQAAERLIALRQNRALIINVEGDQSERLSRAFAERLQERGGRVLGEARVSPELGELASTMRALLGLDESRARHRRVTAITGQTMAFEPARRADLDALFIIARTAEARRLLPELRALGVSDLPWLATSRAHSIPASPQDRDLDGLHFCDQPWMLGESRGLPQREELGAQLQSAAGASARLFALGIDAYRIVPYIDWLQAHPHVAFPGVSGYLRIDSRGVVNRELMWARYAGGRVRVLGTGDGN